MRSIETIRDKKIDEYVHTTRLLFFLLGGILLVRAFQPGEGFFTNVYKNVLLLFLPAAIVLLVTLVLRGKKANELRRLENIINACYLIIIVHLLTQEKESFFKFLLLMPVMVSALRYGTRAGYSWALLATVGIAVIAVAHGMGRMDVDILVAGVIWLMAWLMGKMSETEQETREELRRQASLDELTGVYNHRSFHTFLEECFARARLEGSCLALVMTDIDFFKYYNDAYGHQMGDEVLKKLAEIIKGIVGERGICARYGGDEFAIILPGCDGKDGVELGETIKREVEGTEFEGMSILPKGHLTLSIGVACYPEHAQERELLIQRSDEALFKAKCTNMNRVELYYNVFDEIAHLLQDQEKELLNSMRTLLMVVNAKDRYTYGHSERVMHYTVQIGRKLALWEWEIQNLMIGALLHDIGKIEISRDILNKPGKLTKSEWEPIRQHAVWGADMMRPISSLSGAVNIVLYHHENYDGTGYPHGLKGEEIPLGARILRLADSFDAMVTNRPYKKPKTISEAVGELKKLKNVHYDPDVVDAFIEYLEETGILVLEVS
ncbi:MAG: diguanylate cyclase [Peptococcaceae bacterium]|nr:diguanylate cyclase [Peptococcaceae bacterium]MDH7525885.1 diguanylate cyclase [Peptococcaceae bacterium]